MIRWLASAFAVLATTPALAAGVAESFYQLPTRQGVTQPFLVDAPAGDPSAVVVLFSGGDGVLKLSSAGVGAGQDNFVVRARRIFAAKGLATVLVDAPSDHKDGIWDYRASQSEADDLRPVIAWIKARWTAPIWLMGTSRGTVSAANVAARLGKEGLSGLILTSSVTAGDKQTVYDVKPDQIAGPTLLLHDKSDSCDASPPKGVKKLHDLLPSKLEWISGGAAPASGPCDGLSYHGFYGAEDDAVRRIIKFMTHQEKKARN